MTAMWGQMVSGDSRWNLGSSLPHTMRKLRDHRGADKIRRLDVRRGQEAPLSTGKWVVRRAEPHSGGRVWQKAVPRSPS